MLASPRINIIIRHRGPPKGMLRFMVGAEQKTKTNGKNRGFPSLVYGLPLIFKIYRGNPNYKLLRNRITLSLTIYENITKPIERLLISRPRTVYNTLVYEYMLSLPIIQ